MAVADNSVRIWIATPSSPLRAQLTLKSYSGKLLIAVPQLPDENFFRTVIVILRHTEEGALGLILNRPTSVTLKQVWEKISGDESDMSEPIYFGGPVQGPLMAIHRDASQAEHEVIPGVFYSIRRNQLDDLIREKTLPFKIFSGHSGWGEGQLEREVEAGGWLISPATADHIFDSPDDLWKTVCEQFGNDILIDEKFHSKIPNDPSLN